MSEDERTPFFWNCGCEENYIKSEEYYYCHRCGVNQEEITPQALIVEVMEMLQVETVAEMEASVAYHYMGESDALAIVSSWETGLRPFLEQHRWKLSRFSDEALKIAAERRWAWCQDRAQRWKEIIFDAGVD